MVRSDGRAETRRNQMAKNVSAIVSGAGWVADFMGQLVEGLRRKGCTDEEIHSLVTAKVRPAMEKIVDAVAELIRTAKIGDGRSTEELVRAGNYNYANPDINSRNFPVRPTNCGMREIVLLEFDHDPTSEEVLAEAKKQDLERPVYEDALYFGVEHPEVQRERPVVFLHEPWRNPHGGRYVLYLWSSAGYRRLGLDCFDGRWYRVCRFAFVRK